MSSKRPPAPPPAIDGYRYVSLLGSGGFSDVYLYEQDRPKRKVAVKVLIADLKTEGARRRFESEANLMAQLSTHPFIVTIYEADITADGHSYLAMEYCSRPSLDARYRRGPLGVDEVLSLGVQVASAVETAHRAGIVHRDIKPANILVTDYNRPALTDFGISGTMDSADDDAGMSIPWSPPEAFHSDHADGTKIDVWALGATLYTLLAGRSPFVRPGGDNSQRELMSRIATAPLPSLRRADVPESLELALATAMAKSPSSRFRSAHAFALALQRIQAELNLSVTPFEVLEEAHAADDAPADEHGDATRVRQVVSIDPDGTTRSPTLARPVFPDRDTTRTVPAASGADTTARRPGQDGACPAADDATVLRQAAPAMPSGTQQPAEDSAVGRGKRKPLAIIGATAAALVLVGGAAAIVNMPAPEEEAAPPPVSQPPANAIDGLAGNIVPPEDLDGKIDAGRATFSWTNPDERDGDMFIWTPVTALGKGEPERTREDTVTVPVAENDRTCIEVVVLRANGKSSDPVRGCAD
ncbi:serine/threonine protein kinase [Arthrobacter crystallopoietes BAB-32]|uniref:non-specific serine/threonine protein kinase n=1 Tax=Arthrobacter crystallopoietes BAB-32 TaxID=1246476 RepID=N1V7X8_9MICC|nr:serine/threonine-protein kinase [Arthrobacter crystallopoietes]EMY34333.1 serine/threonine protein kinase [Arthrobacter crystallopoietes BAB-32]